MYVAKRSRPRKNAGQIAQIQQLDDRIDGLVEMDVFAEVGGCSLGHHDELQAVVIDLAEFAKIDDDFPDFDVGNGIKQVFADEMGGQMARYI